MPFKLQHCSIVSVALVLAACSSGGSGPTSVDNTAEPAPEQTPEPTLNLTVSATSVAAGDSVELTWTSSDTTSCTASGAWSGAKSVNGNEEVGNLRSDATFSMSCDGAGGSVSDSVSVAVTMAGSSALNGSVDSSLVDRGGDNRVYVYQGSVAADDFDGDSGDPIMALPVVQDVGACTFAYQLENLAAGEYTLAFTAQGGLDVENQDDTIEFSGQQSIVVSSSPEVVNFSAENVLRVGPGRALQTIAEAADMANDGDVVEIDAGLYPADVATWRQNDLTLRGVGGFAHLRADGANAQGKAIWVTEGSRTTVENIEFSGITVPDQNGAGIRADGRDLVVCNGYFHDSEEGILGGSGDVLIEYSEFDNNGFGDGFSHNMYILDADRFTLRYSYVHHARIGHNVKSRARENYILYNRIMDEDTGTASYAVDIPNGGLSYIIGNLIQQGPNSDNSSILNYGTEGLSGGRTHNLYVVNNTLVDDLGNGTFLQAASGSSLLSLTNNLLLGSGSLVSGASASETSNLRGSASDIVNRGSFDYRLVDSSAAIDAGTDPMSGLGYDLNPIMQYAHPKSGVSRPVDGPLDIGAVEFTPQ